MDQTTVADIIILHLQAHFKGKKQGKLLKNLDILCVSDLYYLR